MIVRSRNVLTRTGLRPASIHIDAGRIVRVSDHDDASGEVFDYGDFHVLPGLVDSHVHVNEPGRTEWEGFETATDAAAAGGVTTIVDMPLNSIPPTTSVRALLAKAEAMEGKCRVDVALWGGAVPGNAGELRPMLREGAAGFKCFLLDSGVPEFGRLDATGLEEALGALRGTGAPLLVHAELAEYLGEGGGMPSRYETYLSSRPRTAEERAIELLYGKCRDGGARAHVVHLSAAEGLDLVRRAADERVPLTAETTPHYLFFDAESVPDGATEYKCAPPIREHENRERLWGGVREGLFSAIVSDHSPCTPELKRLEEGDFMKAWGGIASLQFVLPIVWTEARRRGIALDRIIPLLTSGPAALAGLDRRKGSIAEGYDADFTVFAPGERFVVTPDIVRHRHSITPYRGKELFGVVKATCVRGTFVRENGRNTGARPGRWVRP